MTLNYYSVLKVKESASNDEIKKAYRALARQLHPDKSENPDSEEQFKLVQEAYDCLIDTVQRRVYDIKLSHLGERSRQRSKWNPTPAWKQTPMSTASYYASGFRQYGASANRPTSNDNVPSGDCNLDDNKDDEEDSDEDISRFMGRRIFHNDRAYNNFVQSKKLYDDKIKKQRQQVAEQIRSYVARKGTNQSRATDDWGEIDRSNIWRNKSNTQNHTTDSQGSPLTSFTPESQPTHKKINQRSTTTASSGYARMMYVTGKPSPGFTSEQYVDVRLDDNVISSSDLLSDTDDVIIAEGNDEDDETDFFDSGNDLIFDPYEVQSTDRDTDDCDCRDDVETVETSRNATFIERSTVDENDTVDFEQAWNQYREKGYDKQKKIRIEI